MSKEPTREERQREAFSLLKANARRAHQDGDGLLASSLSETALQEINRLIKEGRLLLPLRELQWAIVFRMFWLLHKHSAHTTFELLKKWPCTNQDDAQVRELLQLYVKLLSEPFQGSAATLDQVNAVPLSAFGDKSSPETIELVRHLIELTWFHTVAEGQWKQVLTKWRASGASWITSALTGFEERLQVQARLTSPTLSNLPLAESVASDLSNTLPLASLWVLNFYGNHTEIGKMVTSLLARYNIEDYQWRLIADFGHTNSWNGKAVDSQAAWIARRRSMTPRFPILLFHDRREVRISELLLELLLTAEHNQGHSRQELYQLAMLHELAALRIWDFWMWKEAVRAQSQGSLEASQWPGNTQDMLAVNGLINGLRSGFLKPQSTLVDRGVEKLEFTQPSLLQLLAEACLTTYPLQMYSTDYLLIKVGDLFPEILWPRLAEWTLAFAESFREQRYFGSKLNIFEPWLNIIPSLPENSPVWNKLQQEVLALSRMGHAWRGGDTETLLVYWLLFSPLELALQLGQQISSVPTSDLGEKLARAKLFIHAEKGRSLLEQRFTRALAAESQDLLVSCLLTSHLGELSTDQVANLRRDVERRIDALLVQALPQVEANHFQMGGWVPGIDMIPSWTQADLPLLDRLIAALNNPALLRPYVPVLLNMMQLMAAYGTPDISQRLIPQITRWIETSPVGRNPLEVATNPFAIARFTDNTFDMDHDLGWLVFQMVRKLDVDGQNLALAWTKRSLLSKATTHLPVAFYQNLVIATKSDPSLAQQALRNLETILFRLCIHAQDGKEEPIIKVLDYMTTALRASSSEVLEWDSPNGAAAMAFLTTWCNENLTWLSRDPNPSLRVTIGSLVSTLRGRTSEAGNLTVILERLQNDNRARVRFAAQGGWDRIRT